MSYVKLARHSEKYGEDHIAISFDCEPREPSVHVGSRASRALEQGLALLARATAASRRTLHVHAYVYADAEGARSHKPPQRMRRPRLPACPSRAPAARTRAPPIASEHGAAPAPAVCCLPSAQKRLPSTTPAPHLRTWSSIRQCRSWHRSRRRRSMHRSTSRTGTHG